MKWPKPDLVKLAQNQPDTKQPTALAHALQRLAPEILAQASEQPDPFGWLLDAVDMEKWSQSCRGRKEPWMGRVWLAAASQLRAERRLIHQAHGWRDTWEELRQHRDQPDLAAKADDFFLAQLAHANDQRRTELPAMPSFQERLAQARKNKDDAILRRFRRARQGQGRRAGVARAERYLVQNWLEMPRGLPGLCFFSDAALDNLLKALGLRTGEDWATKQFRVRLGLIQAGIKRHLIEDVIDPKAQLRFTSDSLKKTWIFTGGPITWDGRRLWP
jgi:hypothetical protein